MGSSRPVIKGRFCFAIFSSDLRKIVMSGKVDSMDKLHGTANFSQLTAYSWNIFRYVGDYLHLFGIVVLLLTIMKNKSLNGFSRSTQILYFLVFATRYLDLLHHSQTTYL